VPRETDTVDAAGLRFEVVDMDRQRVDKLLIAHLPGAVDDDSV
jgi:CBS domain containing-hemolysin-like protein